MLDHQRREDLPARLGVAPGEPYGSDGVMSEVVFMLPIENALSARSRLVSCP